MDKTPFAGLTRLDRTDDLSADGASFQAINPTITDRLLEIGAISHRHDAHDPLADPVLAPSATVQVTNGSIGPDLTLAFGYTLVDGDLGETALSGVIEVSTPLSLEPPDNAPTVEVQYTAGSLMTDVYFYAVTLTDGEGGETGIGAWSEAEREPGFASGQVVISDLDVILAEDPDAVNWRLYRARGGNEFVFLAEGDTDTYTDDGSVSPDCDTHPPAPTDNTTHAANSVDVIVPSDDFGDAAFFRLYCSIDGSFTEDCLVGDFDLGDADGVITVIDLDFDPERPPDVSRSIRGASKIDPDLELLDWHWKRPVETATDLGSGERGDVRMVLDEVTLYAASADVATWDQWTAFLPFDFEFPPGTFGDFHWYSPVTSSASLGSGAQGAVRLATNEMRIYAASAAVASSQQWTPVAGIWREPVSGSGALTTGRRGDVRIAEDTKQVYFASAEISTASQWSRIVPGSATMGFAKHFNSAAYGRPPGYGMVTWEGSVEPLNSIDGDAWVDTT